jgi:integrase/recombinase XerD
MTVIVRLRRSQPGAVRLNWVITRCITRSVSVPGATIRAMPGALERLPAHVPVAAPAAGPAMLAAELVGRVRAELPMVGKLEEREQLLVAAWLTGLRSARTRRAYAGDVAAWFGWLTERETGALAAGRVHVDLWAATQLDAGAAASSVRRRLSALSSFYRYCAAHDLIGRVPTHGVARPVVDPDYTATVGLDRDQARALVAAADADSGAQVLRTAAVVRLLMHNALRVDEACAADIADLGEDSGHRVLRVVRKGGRKAKIPLTPATVAALEAYLVDRAHRAGAGEWRQLSGPLLATAVGGRLRQSHLWELVRRLARTAGIGAWEQLSPHSLRHSAITFALDAGASLRDVQDYAGHKDPRTTRRYDHSRNSLDRNAAYTVAAYLA